MRFPLPQPRALSFFMPGLLALMILSACGTTASAQADLDSRLLGVWLTETGATYTITANNGEYALAIVDYDDEVFQVQSLTWNEGVLAWRYFVPSSSTSVSEETIRIRENQIEVQWENSVGSTGTDLLTRAE